MINKIKQTFKNYWFSSDLHVGHTNILKYSARTAFMTADDLAEFNKIKDDNGGAFRAWRPSLSSVNNMDENLIDKINSVVGVDDLYCHLGDIAIETDSKFRGLETIKKIKCKNIVLLLGNHDKIKDLIAIKDGIPSKNIMIDKVCELAVGEQSIFMSHYAHLVWNKSAYGNWHLFGHSHSSLNGQIKTLLPDAKMMDVGVDCHKDYMPFSFDEIKAHMDTISGNGHRIDHHGPMKIIRDSNGEH